MIVEGRIVRGVGHFRVRMTAYPDVFERATGEKLFPGTLNVQVAQPIPIRTDFRIEGRDINEPNQDLLFERCRINGIDAYRIRPSDAQGNGGHGDHILEIACTQKLSGVDVDAVVKIELFRNPA